MLSTRRNGETPADARADLSPPEILQHLIAQAEEAGASDVHLQMNRLMAAISFRVDGVLAPFTELHTDLAERLFGRIKFLARLKTYQQSLPQEGRIEKAEIGSQSDIRVATYPTVTGEKIVLRLFGGAATDTKTLDALGFPDQALNDLKTFLGQTAGMLLLTGPAGSGKTTTIYACLRALAEGGARHIITVEDPAEQIVPGIMQTEINEAAGLNFAQAARHLLRQDPQALVIGEIRDEETANIAIRAALTGHLVVSTLHAGSCRGVFERLSVLCRDHSAIASSIELVINQRLIRGICMPCHGRGCPACLKTGYRGRLPLVESFKVSNDLRPMIANNNFSRISPDTSLFAHARRLIEQDRTKQAEIDRVLGSSRQA